MPIDSMTADRGVYIGRVDQIPLGEGRSMRIRDTEIAVFRSRDGQVFAVQSRCPHLGGPLADGITAAGRVTCPLHGFVFELSSGRPVGNACHALRTFAVQVGPSGELSIEVGELSRSV